MQLLKKIPFLLFLLALFYCLHGSVDNYGYLDLYEVMQAGGSILLCIAVFFVLAWLFTRDYLFAPVVTFFIALWYLFFGAIHDAIKATAFLGFLQPYLLLLLILLVVNFAFTWWLKKSKYLYQKLFLYFNMLFSIFCLYYFILLVNKTVNGTETSIAKQVKFDETSVKTKPDVYFLLFDCYAGYESLQDNFAFKNDSLFDFLAQKSVKLLSSISNYNFTFFSMASMLNIQYISDDYQGSLAVQKDLQKRIHEINQAEIFSVFNSMQYSIKNFPIFDLKNYKGISNHDTVVPMHLYLVTNKLFHNRLLKDISYILQNVNYFSRKHIFEHDHDNITAYNKTMYAILKKSTSPKFVYSHFLMPHAPYFKDSAGNYLPVREFNVTCKKHYLSYLKYTNTVIQSIIKAITAANPQAVLIFTSDHGYNDKGSVRFYDMAKIAAEQYSFNNIFAVRFPDGYYDSTKSEIRRVNFFRYLIDSQYSQKISYLNDSTV